MNPRPPIGTWAILGIYILVFLAFGLSNTSGSNLMRAGAQDGISVASGETWRLISSCFVHIGLMHLLFNSVALNYLGSWVEREVGTERFLFLYLVTGLGGSVASTLFLPAQVICAGGSGAIFGLVGVLIGIFLREGRSVREAFENPQMRAILILLGANLVITFLLPIPIGHAAHIGGLLTGFLAILCLFRLRSSGGRPARPPWIRSVAFLVFLAGLSFLAILPYNRSWYQCRQLWFAEPEEEARIESALRAWPEGGVLVDFLLAGKRALAKEDPSQYVQAINARNERGEEPLRAFILGSGIRKVASRRLIAALQSLEDEQLRAVPYDLWQRIED